MESQIQAVRSVPRGARWASRRDDDDVDEVGRRVAQQPDVMSDLRPAQTGQHPERTNPDINRQPEKQPVHPRGRTGAGLFLGNHHRVQLRHLDAIRCVAEGSATPLVGRWN